MGGGSKSTPAPKSFTPPPVNDGPAANPIANFFGARGTGQAPANPFAALAQMPVQQAQNPFAGFGGQQGQQGQMTPEMVEALLRKIRGQG